MNQEFHELCKVAIRNTGNLSSLVGDRIYDTLPPTDIEAPYVVWRLEAVQRVASFDEKVRMSASVVCVLVTDFTKGVDHHLSFVDALQTLQFHKQEGVGIDRVTFQLRSSGEVRVEDRYCVSETIFAAEGCSV